MNIQQLLLVYCITLHAVFVVPMLLLCPVKFCHMMFACVVYFVTGSSHLISRVGLVYSSHFYKIGKHSLNKKKIVDSSHLQHTSST